MGTPFQHVVHVRFEEVDAAGIVYFGRFFTWCHDAMGELLAPVDGGYAGLVRDRRLGFPTVHAEADYHAPLRFGDEVRIAVVVERIGRSSVALRFDLSRAKGQRVATVRHTVALTSLASMRSQPLPDDIRRALERHTAEPG